MAQTPESDWTQSSDTQLAAINCFPNDVAIVSIRDARRRLALADGIQKNLRHLAEELRQLRRDALEAAGIHDAEAAHDPDLMRSLLKKALSPATGATIGLAT